MKKTIKKVNRKRGTEAIAIAKVLRHKASESEKQVANNAIGTLLKECKEYDCFTEVYEMLCEARKRLKMDSDSDSDDSDFDDIFDGDGTRVQYDTPNFQIDYTTTAGADDIVQDPNSDTAVNVTLQDGTVIGTTTQGNGVPDFVKMLGIWLEYYLQQFIAYGFNNIIQTDVNGNPIKQRVVIQTGGSKTSPGDAIYIENTLGSASGLAGGYNTATTGMGITPGHELFHQVQYTYNDLSNTVGGGFLRIYKEGTARLAEDLVNDAYNRYNKEVPIYLNNTTVDHFSVLNRYRTVLFWKYLTEQLGAVTTEPQRGVDAIISLWQNLVGANSAADGINATDNTISALPNGVSIQDTFSKFAIANYLKDLGDPFIEAQYDYLEDEEPRVPGGQVYSSLTLLDSQILNGLSDDYFDSRTVNSWGLHYYEFDIGSSIQDLTVDLIADAAFTDPFYRILEIRAGDVTIHEGSGTNYTEQIINDITDPAATPVDKIVVIVGAFADGGAYDLTVSVNEGVPSVVLVLDHSGSMSSQNKMVSARNAASLFVDVAEANGVPGLGAVGFSTTAAVLTNSELDILNALKANNIKGDISALSPTNLTSIGHGLQIAKDEFVGDPVDATNEVLVLLSDGKENTSPMIADVQTDIINAGMKVYTIGLGTDWAIEPQKLEDLATDTSADYIMTDDPALLQEFYLQILASILGGGMNGGNDSDETSDSDSYAANIFVGPFTKENYSIGTKSKQIHVIPSDRQLNVILTWREADIKNIGLVLVGPNNTKFTEQDAKDNNIIYKRGVNYAFFTIKLPCKGNRAGIWTAYAMLPVNSNVNYELKSMITSGLRLSVDTAQPILKTGDKIGMTVKLNNGGQPVSGAIVKVISDQPLVGIGNYLAQEMTVSGKQSISNDPISAKEMKMTALIKKESTNPFKRQVNEYNLNEDLTQGLGIYTNDMYVATTPGSYNFKIVVEGHTADGEPFTRTKTITKVVRVNTNSESSIIDVSLIDKTSNTVIIKFTPVDIYGNRMGPGYSRDIRFITKSGKLTGNLVDHNNGVYSQKISVKDPQPPQISIQVRSEMVPVPSSKIVETLEGPATVEVLEPSNVTGWLARIAIVLALIAIAMRFINI
jgi:hypothetical protein